MDGEAEGLKKKNVRILSVGLGEGCLAWWELSVMDYGNIPLSFINYYTKAGKSKVNTKATFLSPSYQRSTLIIPMYTYQLHPNKSIPRAWVAQHPISR